MSAEPTLPAHARTRETDSGRNATGLARVWSRLERAEEAMATMGAGLSVTQRLMDELGVTRRQARALQAAVRLRWRQESQTESREQRLERYRRTLEQVVKQGFERKVTVLVDAKAGEYDVVPQPDLKAVTAATALLIKLDGGDEAFKALPSGEPVGEDATGTPVGPVLLVDRRDASEVLRKQRATQIEQAKKAGTE
jgi:hypothetical protein